jgi:hypothetical protein
MDKCTEFELELLICLTNNQITKEFKDFIDEMIDEQLVKYSLKAKLRHAFIHNCYNCVIYKVHNWDNSLEPYLSFQNLIEQSFVDDIIKLDEETRVKVFTKTWGKRNKNNIYKSI